MASSSDEPTLNAIQLEFKQSVGHFPHTIPQLLQYCKHNKLPFKYRQIKSWWRNRPNPTCKPVQPSINETVDPLDVYSHKDSILEVMCCGYIRLFISPLLTKNTIIPIDIIRTIYQYYEVNKFKSIFLARKDIFDPFYMCVNMNDDRINMRKSKRYGTNQLTWQYRGYCNATDIHLNYPSIAQSLINKRYIAATKYIALNGIFGSSTCAVYQSKYYHNVLFHFDESTSNASIELYPYDLPPAPGRGIRSAVYENKQGFIIACDNDNDNYWQSRTVTVRKQTYYQLVEVDNQLKWNEIKNELSIKSGSSIALVNNGNDLFVVGFDAAIYNFKRKKWKQLNPLVDNYNQRSHRHKPKLCCDEGNVLVYCYFINNNCVDIYCYDLVNDEWNKHSVLKLQGWYANNVFMWIENDGVLCMYLNHAASKCDTGKVYEFGADGELWICDANKTKVFSEYKEIQYIFR